MKVKILLFAGMVLFSLAFVLAHENFTETKELIDSGVSCNKLTSSQLEEIGDYYMEQMHPGEAHETRRNQGDYNRSRFRVGKTCKPDQASLWPGHNYD